MPAGIEVYRRTGEDKLIYILVNLGKKTETVDLPAEMTDILHDGLVKRVTLQAHDVAVFRQPHDIDCASPLRLKL